MTIIIGYTNHLFSVLVADRLTTIGGVANNTHANKVIVSRFRDGWLSLGYTGLAIIDQRPTDDWLMSLTVPSVKNRPGLSFRCNDDIPKTVDSYIGRLVTGLRRNIPSMPSVVRESLEIGISGVRFSRDMVWPFLLTLYKEPRSSSFKLMLRSRDTQLNVRSHAVWVSGGWGRAKPSTLASLTQQLGLIDPRFDLGPEIVAEMLRSSALSFGAGEAVIGQELCTIIHAPIAGGSVIDFHSIKAHALNGELSTILGRHLVSYSPWILGHQTVASPLAISGTSTLQVGGHPIEIRGHGSSEFFSMTPDHPRFSGPIDDA